MSFSPSFGPSDFPATRWSMVRRAVAFDDPSANESLNDLFKIYDRPVLEFIKRSGFREAEAEDVKQEFLLALCRADFFSRADGSKGRLRAFMVTLLGRFIADHLRRNKALKRGGGRVVSLQGLSPGERRTAEPVSGHTPYDAYQRAWLRVVTENAMIKLQADYARTGRAEYFEALAPYIRAEGEAGQAAIAERFGKALGTVKSDVSRLKARCGNLVKQEIARTLEDPTPENIMAEIRDLYAYKD